MSRHCIGCGKVNLSEHSNYCPKCFRERRAEYMREYKRKRVANGQCVVCGLDAEHGRTKCRFCAEMQNSPRRMANKGEKHDEK